MLVFRFFAPGSLEVLVIGTLAVLLMGHLGRPIDSWPETWQKHDHRLRANTTYRRWFQRWTAESVEEWRRFFHGATRSLLLLFFILVLLRELLN